MKFKSNIEIQAGVEADGSIGSNGQVLSSTGSGVAWVDASIVIGGPYLPLTAGAGYPLTGTLYLSNVESDQKIQFQRTGGNVYSIEHDSAQLYFYNRTTTESPLVIQNDGDVIMNAGAVGIGTDSPGSKLVVSNDNFSFIDIITPNFGPLGGTVMSIGTSLSYGIISSNTDLRFLVGSGREIYMSYSGDVGIGTANPVAKLQVKKAIAGNETLLGIEASGVGTGVLGSITYDQSDDTMRLLNNSTFGGTSLRLGTLSNDDLVIDYYGNVGIGTTSPRYQLDLAKPNNSSQVDYIALGVNDGPSGGGGNTLGSGLIWKANYANYTKRSAGIVQIAEAHYFRSGLAFYTNNSPNDTGDWDERMRIDMHGNVGIGTTSPSYELDVSGTTRSNEFISRPQEGTKVSYIANVGNTDNIGGSANGPASFAGGSGNEVYGWKSIANGTNNRTGTSSMAGGGVNSAAFGLNNVASNLESIALGRTNTSSGIASVAVGDTLTASGNHSFACNINNTASGDGAIAGGFNTVASGDYSVSLGINTTATAMHAFVIGDNCDATAARAFATGINSVASGESSVAHGNNNVANGNNSFVSGANSTASGFNSTALGNNLSVTSGAGTAVGVWNQDAGNYRFQVGVGTSNANRVNAFSINNSGVILAHVLKNSPSYSNDSQAAVGGVPIGGLYRHGNVVQIRIT
jgi:hypothetical protein